MSTPETLKQRTRAVPTSIGEITVRRMFHKPARAFVKLLGQELKARSALLSISADGKLSVDASKLLESLGDLIASTDSLAEHVVGASTDTPAADLDKLDFAEWLEVLRAALELNLGEDLKNSFAGISATIATLLSAETKTSTGA